MRPLTEKGCKEELKLQVKQGIHLENLLGSKSIIIIPKNNPWIPYYGYGAGVVSYP